MGVRGLTTYVAKYSDRYLEPHELKNCALVIDGNSLASLLYNWHSKCICAFGGDYDKYVHCVQKFFGMLIKCGVSPLVLFDGGYEAKKLRTVKKRLKRKIVLAKHITPTSNGKFFPLLMKEVFKDVLTDLNIPFAQCLFEADDEIAAVARRLNCPVLSYDSDFYVYDVMYIPFPTMSIEVSKRYVESDQKVEFYVSCSIYQVESFLNKVGGIHKSLIPLMATLLGNDFISRNVFRNFFSNYLKFEKKRSLSNTQKCIASLLLWLKSETLESATAKVLSTLKLEYRYHVSKKIRLTIEGYTKCNSVLLPYLHLPTKKEAPLLMGSANSNLICNLGNLEPTCVNNTIASVNESLDMNCSNESEGKIEDSDTDSTSNPSIEDGEPEGDALNDIELQNFEPTCVNNTIALVNESLDINNSNESEGKIEDSDTDSTSNPSIEDGEPEGDALNDIELQNFATPAAASGPTKTLPYWFKDSFHRGNLPPYFMDMITRKTYFCAPQVEDYDLAFAHEISLPIIDVIFRLLTARNGLKKPLLYYGRNKHHQPERLFLNPDNTLQSDLPSLSTLSELPVEKRKAILFKSLELSDEDDKVLCGFPKDWQIFIISLLYWVRHCTHPTISNCHIHAILLSLVTLNVVDKHTGYCRSKSAFLKAFGKKLKTIRESKQKKKSRSFIHSLKVKKSVTGIVMVTDILDNMSVTDLLTVVNEEDCILVAETLLPYHQINERLKDNGKLYSVTTVHSFAQLQSCLLHIMNLNALLNFPLLQCQTANFFTGTFVYNAYTNLKKCVDADVFIDIILGCGASVRDVYNLLSMSVQSLLPGINPVRKKRKKRRNCASKTKSVSIGNKENSTHLEKECENSQDEDDTDFEDLNNKFSVLAKISI